MDQGAPDLSEGKPRDDWPHIVGDVGGTNARFALVEHPHRSVTFPFILPSREFSSLAHAVKAYLELAKHKGMEKPPRAGCVAVAGPVLGDQIALTNVAWQFSVEETRAQLGLRRLLVVNDFLALAMAVPSLPPAELLPLGLAPLDRHSECGTHPIAVIGPGTGLGVALIVPRPTLSDGTASWSAIATEGGHVSLSPDSGRETDLLRIIGANGGHVSAEAVLSGPGLERLHRALQVMATGNPGAALRAEDILGRGLDGSEPACTASLELFASMLGSFAGNVALTTGARGGVYVSGGVAQRLGPWLVESRFRESFERKGVMSDYLRAVPTFLITAAQPTFAGAARLLEV